MSAATAFARIRRQLVSAVAAMAAGVALGADGAAEARKNVRKSQTPPTYYVDKGSIGGLCSDARPAAVVLSAATPWCSLTRAVVAAPAGSVVMVRAGSYPLLRVDGARRPAMVTFRRLGSEPVTVAGMLLTDSHRLRFEGFRFSGAPRIGSGTVGIQLAGSVLPSSGIGISAGADDVLIEGNRISSEGSGITLSSDNTKPPITDVVIRGNHLDGIGGDAIQAKNFQRLTVEGNEISRVVRSGPAVHPDVLQTVFGGSDLVFRNNYVHDHESQVVLVGDGAVRNVTIENNLVLRASGPYQGLYLNSVVTGLRVVNNTIAQGVSISNSSGAVVANNLFRSFNINDGVTFAYRDYNVYPGGNVFREGRGAPHDLLRSWPRFDSYGEPALGQPGIDTGNGNYAPELDRRGLRRVDDPDTPNRGVGTRSFVDLGADERQDRINPTLKLKVGKRFQRKRRRFVTYARCSEPCSVRGTGRVSVRKPLRRKRKATRRQSGRRGKARKRRFVRARFKATRASVASGERGRLTLRLTRRGARKLRRAGGNRTRGGRRRRAAMVRVTFVATDLNGNRQTVKRRFRLRRY